MSRVRNVVGLVAVLALTACSGGDEETAPTTTSGFSPDLDDSGGGAEDDVAETSTTVPQIARPDVDPLSCAGLLDFDDTDFALGLLDLPMSERGLFTFSQGETCRYRWEADENRTATIEPGLPSDTEPGAALLDVTGESVSDVGDAAAWFDSGDTGLLAVGAATTLGQLNFRLILGRPDIGAAERRAVAVELAARILPRFPGVEAPPPPEVDLAARRAPADRSVDGWREWWEAGVTDGRWEPGVALVELVGAMTGSGASTDVPAFDGPAASGTALVSAARAALDDGTAGDSAAELRALLDDAFPTRERLAAATLVPPADEAAADTETSTTTTVVSGFRRAAPQPGGACDEPIWDGTCMVTISIPELDDAYGSGKYEIYVGGTNESPEFPGWSDDDVFTVIQAMTAAATRFEGLGTMPVTSVLLATGDGAPTLSDPLPDLCTILLKPAIQDYVEAQTRQFVAGQMAHCFLAATFPALSAGTYDAGAWWSAGAAIWLSNEVEPDANLEWVYLPTQLTAHELQTSVLDRSQTNGMWFQHLRWAYGIDGVLGEMTGMPASPGAAALAGWPGMAGTFHDYVESLSDLGVPDSGQDQLAGQYDVPADLIEVDAPTSAIVVLDAFRMNRLQLSVLNGDVACVDAEPLDGATLSWREGGPAETGVWSQELPDTVEGSAMFAGSSLVDGSAFRVTVTDVVDDPDDCDPDEGSADGGDSGGGCELECGPSEYYSEPRN